MIYFATLRSTAQFSSVKKNLQERGLEILKYYPKLKVLKIESQKKIKTYRISRLCNFRRRKN